MKTLLKFLLILILLVATHPIWLPWIGEALTVAPNPHKADCIVVLRGDEYFRFQAAANLQKEGWAPYVVTSVTPADINPYNLDHVMAHYEKISREELLRRYFKYFGLEENNLILTGEEVTSTYTEAEAARRLMEKKGWKSALIVTGPYHMRRTKFLFDLVFRGSGITLFQATAKHTLFDPAHWWRKERDIRAVTDEYGAFIFNLIRHVFLRTGRSSFDTV